MNKFVFYLILPLTFSILACNKTKLSNSEAKNLIEKSLNLPQKFCIQLDYLSHAKQNEVSYITTLSEMGYLNYEFNTIYNRISLGSNPQLGNQANQYVLERKNIGTDNWQIVFKTFEVVLGEIDGIAINKESKTASIRFSLKIVNAAPYVQKAEDNININNPIRCELLFKKFDTGWKIEKSSEEPIKILRSLLNDNKYISGTSGWYN